MLVDQSFEVRLIVGAERSFFSVGSTMNLEVQPALYPEMKLPEHGAEKTSPSTPKLRMCEAIRPANSLCITWHLIKHEDKIFCLCDG